jgi:hypothetical protein
MLLLLVVESRLRQFVYFQGRLETSCKQKLVLSTSAKASIPSQVIVFARPSQNQRAPGVSTSELEAAPSEISKNRGGIGGGCTEE